MPWWENRIADFALDVHSQVFGGRITAIPQYWSESPIVQTGTRITFPELGVAGSEYKSASIGNERFLSDIGLMSYRLPFANSEERVNGRASGDNPISETGATEEAQRGLEKLLHIVEGIVLFICGLTVTGWTENWRRGKVVGFALGFLLILAGILVFSA